MRGRGSVYHRCGCRSMETNRQLGRECARLAEPEHGSWYFAVDVPRYPDGCARHRVRRGGYPTREHALAALEEIRCPPSRPDAPGTVSTGAWLRTWLGSRVSLAPATAKAYAFHVRLHLEPALGRIPLKELRGTHVQQMFNRLATGGKHRRPLSPSTLERIRVTLRVALNAAIRDGLIEHNPARHLELPRPHRPRAVIWTEDQVEQWKRTGAPVGRGVDCGADRAVPPYHPRPPPLRGVPPRRAPGTAAC